MISRTHGLFLSLLLGAASAAGAYAIIGTAQLGDAQTKPEVVSSRQIAKRARKLDSWEASLQKALKARPPALAPLNRYAAVTFVAGPGAASLPTTVAPPRRTVQQTEPAARQVTEVQPKHRVAVAAATRDADTPKSAAPVAVAEPEHTTPAPAAPIKVAVAAPTPAATQEHHENKDDTQAPATTPPATLSVEQQCRLLLRAAEGKSEQVKQDAERQCEALKQAAEKKG
jgi:hypothetical protein